MRIVDFSTRRPVAVFIFSLAAVVFGFVAFRELAVDLLPDITYPSLSVRTEYEGMAPAEVETLLTRPIEDAVGVVNNVVRVTSSSRADVSEVTLEFSWGTDMDFAALDVRERLDVVRLPPAAAKPILLRYDPSLDPIMRIGLFGPDDLSRLRFTAEERVKRALERLEGVAAAIVSGGLEEEIQVEIDERRLTNLGLSMDQVRTRLAAENVNLTGGRLREGETEYLVRTINEYLRAEDIEAIVIDRSEGAIVRLADVARVYTGHKEREIITRINGAESVEIAVYKEGGTNTVSVADAVQERLQSLGEELRVIDPALRLEIITDQANYIRQSVNEVKQTALFGGLLAILVLYFFLRSMAKTIIIGLSIPVSVVATFFLMYVSHISLNIMSLGGLTLGIGLLVDNAIVVLESIDRHRERGLSQSESARVGTVEVGRAIIASTLTTICVFVPIVFVEGVAAQLFSDQALTVAFSLIVSLGVALTLIPMLASREMARSKDEDGFRSADRTIVEWFGLFLFSFFKLLEVPAILLSMIAPRFVDSFVKKLDGSLALLARSAGVPVDEASPHSGRLNLLHWLSLTLHSFITVGLRFVKNVTSVLGRFLSWIIRPLLNLFDRRLASLRASYASALDRVLMRPGQVLIVTLLILAASLLLFGRLGRELVPELIQGEFFTDVELPPGTRLEVTDRRLTSLDDFAERMPGVRTVYSVAGTSHEQGGVAGELRENLGQMTVTLYPPVSRIREESLIAKLRERLDADSRLLASGNRSGEGERPPIVHRFGRPSYFSFRTPIEIEIRGHSLQLLERLADETLRRMQGIPGLADVKSSTEGGHPELQVRFDRDQLARHGLTVSQVANLLRAKIQGDITTDIVRSDRTIDIRLRAQEEFRDSVRDLEQLNVAQSGRTPLPLASVADVISIEGPAEIRRADGSRMARLTANISGRDLGSVSRDIQNAMNAMHWPLGYDWRLGGQEQEMRTSFESMKLAILLAVFMVYLVMASQFESLIHPFVILFSVPFAVIGVLITMFVFGVTVSVVSMIGFVLLAGIVVNNAIVLVDYTNQLRRDGLDKIAALKRAGEVRLRPILMTTATTVLGLFPMALGLGEGAELRTPMALTVIGGLLASTLLTLLVVPAVYVILDRSK